jgi:hypothetical protein
MLSFLLIFILSFVCESSRADARKSFQNKRQVSAPVMIEEIEEAFTLIFENYQPDNPAKDPFYISLENAKANISSLKDAMKNNDKNTGKLIGDITTSIADVRVSYRYEKIDNKNVEIGITTFANCWDAFSQHYIESLPQKNSKFTQEDEKQMEELKTKSMELDKKFSDLEQKMSSSKELINEIKEMKEENSRILEAQNNSAGLMTALTVFQSLMGWWNGFYRTTTFYYPSYVPYFVDCNDYWYCYNSVVLPAYNDYFIGISPAGYWNTYWECDRPIFIEDDKYYVIDSRDQIILDNRGPVYTDVVKDSGTFYVEDNTFYEETTTYTEETIYTEE